MRKKLLESVFLIFFLALWFFSWLDKVYLLELVSLLGIVGVGYVFKSSLRLKLIIGSFVLALSLPIVTLTLGKTWYWVTVFMVLPSYYLGSLIRSSKAPFKALIFSGLMSVPLVVSFRLNAHIWIIIALYWLVLGLVSGLVHFSGFETLVPPLITYIISLIIAITPAVQENQLLKAASLIVLLPVYPVAAWVTRILTSKRK